MAINMRPGKKFWTEAKEIAKRIQKEVDEPSEVTYDSVADYVFDLARFMLSQNIDNRMSALSRKDLEDITKKFWQKDVGKPSENTYDAWATKNPVLPCNPSDPDFAGKWNKGVDVAQDMRPGIQDKLKDLQVRASKASVEGLPVAPSMAEASISMMQMQEDDWSAALDILYGDEAKDEQSEMEVPS